MPIICPNPLRFARRRAGRRVANRRQSSIHVDLEKVASPRCGLMTPIGTERANAISERESNNETDPDSNFEARRHDPRNARLRSLVSADLAAVTEDDGGVFRQSVHAAA
jgi:hypothetical protein